MGKASTKSEPVLEAASPIRARVIMGSNGRIVIPAEVREALGLQDDEKLVLTAGPDGIVLKTVDMAIRTIQMRYKGTVPPGHSVVDEFIREKRAEAERE